MARRRQAASRRRTSRARYSPSKRRSYSGSRRRTSSARGRRSGNSGTLRIVIEQPTGFSPAGNMVNGSGMPVQPVFPKRAKF